MTKEGDFFSTVDDVARIRLPLWTKVMVRLIRRWRIPT